MNREEAKNLACRCKPKAKSASFCWNCWFNWSTQDDHHWQQQQQPVAFIAGPILISDGAERDVSGVHLQSRLLVYLARPREQFTPCLNTPWCCPASLLRATEQTGDEEDGVLFTVVLPLPAGHHAGMKHAQLQLLTSLSFALFLKLLDNLPDWTINVKLETLWAWLSLLFSPRLSRHRSDMHYLTLGWGTRDVSPTSAKLKDDWKIKAQVLTHHLHFF